MDDSEASAIAKDSGTEDLDASRVGPYRLIRELGSGGQGSVFLAQDTRIARHVALKLLRSGFVSEAERRRFRREAEVIANLDHPGICGVLEADVEGEVPYIAMRYVKGVSLAQAIHAAATRDACESELDDGMREAITSCCAPTTRSELFSVLRTFERMARALHAAHEIGVIHRDIKPGNIAITPAGEPVVLDFGIARDQAAVTEALTMSGEIFGTPLYMSPEQLEGHSERLDRRTDVYALGVTLFEALTLKRPFERDNRLELERAILYEPVPNPRALAPVITDELKVVLETALDKDRDRRYATALELAEDLRRICEYEPIHAQPAGWWLHFHRWVRRNPALATALIATLLLLVGGLGISLTLLSSEREAVQQKQTALDEKTRALDRAQGLLLSQRTSAMIATDPAAALALGLRAVEAAPNYQTLSALYAPLFACQLERVLEGNPADRVWDMAISTDGQTIVGGLDHSSVRIWSLSDGTSLRKIETVGTVVRRVALHPSGRWLVSASYTEAQVPEDPLLKNTGADPDDDAQMTSPESGVSAIEIFDLSKEDNRCVERLDLGTSPILWLEFSRDGRALVAQPAEEDAALWSVEGWSLRARLKTPANTVGRASFSPSGRHILTSSTRPTGTQRPASNDAHLWDAHTGELLQALIEHEAAIYCADFDPSGQRIVTGDIAGRLLLWNLLGEVLEELQLSGAIASLAFSPVGARLAVSVRESIAGLTTQPSMPKAGLRLFQVEPQGTLRSIRTKADPDGTEIGDLRWSPDGSRIATSSGNRLSILDGQTGERLRDLRAQILLIETQWTPDGRRVVSLSQSPRLHVWRAGNLSHAYQLSGHAGPVNWATFAANGRRAITASADGTLRVWHTPVGRDEDERLDPGTCIGVLEGHAGGVTCADLDDERGQLVSGGRDRSLVLWDLQTHRKLCESKNLAATPTRVVLSASHQRAAVMDEEGRIELHWLDGSGNRRVLVESGALGVRSEPSGDRLACVGLGSRIDFFDWTNGAALAEITYESYRPQASVSDLAFRSDGREIAIACSDKFLRLYDPVTLQPSRDPVSFFRARTLEYQASGDHLVVIGFRGGGAIRVVEPAGGKSHQPSAFHVGPIVQAIFDPSGECVVSAGSDGAVHVWQAADGQARVHMRIHEAPLTTICSSQAATGARVLSADEAGKVLIWPIDVHSAALDRRPRRLRVWELERALRLAGLQLEPTGPADE
ncbi:MAG: WD40 repeat protein/serine/threonine protein kinase [Planctomycetota bacterium]